jgi:alpha-L-rhamnosidase
VMDAFDNWRGADGLLSAPPGWNFVDWTQNWGAWDRMTAPVAGVPPKADREPSGILNWQLVYTLTRVAELEQWLDEPERAARCQRGARELAALSDKAFWDETRGLYADDLGHAFFSEHAQCLALLSGMVPPERKARIGRALINDPDIERATIYFMHYLFEAFQSLRMPEETLRRLDLWFGLQAQGFRTTPETPEPARSDCHAWGAHPLYHYHASILGVRPATFGFASVRIEPQLGALQFANGRLPHPLGEIVTQFRRENDSVHWQVSLPPSVAGILVLGGREIELPAGRTSDGSVTTA